MERKRVENRLEELCVNSLVFVPLFIVIRRRETCSPSNTKSIKKDLLDPKGFLIYLYSGLQSQYVLEHMSQQFVYCLNFKSLYLNSSVSNLIYFFLIGFLEI